MLQAISGYDPQDSTSLKIDTPTFYDKLQAKIPQKIGIIRNIKSELLDSEIAENFEMNLDFFRKSGIEIVPLDIPLLDYSVAIFIFVACSEASSNLIRW